MRGDGKASGTRNGRARLTLDQVKEIRLQILLDRRARTNFATIEMLAEDFKVGRTTVQSIIKGNSWTMPEAFPDI